MFEKMIPQDKLVDYVCLLQKCHAAPILGKFPLDDVRYVCESALTINAVLFGGTALTGKVMALLQTLHAVTTNYETHGEEVDHLAHAGTHCCKCPARVTCKARQDYLTNAFNTTDTK